VLIRLYLPSSGLSKKKTVDSGIAQLPQERGEIKSLNLAVKNDDWLSKIVFGVPLPGSEDEEDHHACQCKCFGDIRDVRANAP